MLYALSKLSDVPYVLSCSIVWRSRYGLPNLKMTFHGGEGEAVLTEHLQRASFKFYAEKIY